MEFKGTKGKWYLQPYTDAYTNIIRCDNGKGFDTLYLVSARRDSCKEERYNGLLMSKAPEMLEELHETIIDLKILKNQISDALKTNHLFEGMPELIDGWINRKTKLIKEATELN